MLQVQPVAARQSLGDDTGDEGQIGPWKGNSLVQWTDKSVDTAVVAGVVVAIVAVPDVDSAAVANTTKLEKVH